ncbi:MAG: L(+)-tartrate dehydratase subunit alpha [Clostridiales bacterium]|nr:L(+)-tartrate dehydratase subunit alpha [Clostridiales bacterium]
MNLCDKKEVFIDLVARFTEYSSKHLPDDVLEKLSELRGFEQTDFAKIIYDAMFQNIDKADELSRPVCQDTGVLQYFLRVGTRFPLIDCLDDALREAVILATERAPLRHNAVEIFDEKNTGNNVGHRIPWIETELIPESDSLELCMYMAGGGCSLPGIAQVLMPLEGYEGIISFVFDRITTYGINACPPLLVGIGIAGSVEVAAKLSKKALLRPIGSSNSNPLGAELEKRIEDGLNEIGIGPGGMTGSMSVMGVHIEQAARHPATLAVGLSTGCWAHRRAWIRINADMSYELLSHREGRL